MPRPHPPLPESTLGTPDDANDTEGVHSVAHSIRQEGAALRTVVSSTARTTVHGAAGREAVRIGCRCRTPRFRRARSARQTTRRTPKVCIPSPIPSVSTAHCCTLSSAVRPV